MIKLPKKIKVGGAVYKVNLGKETENGYVGYHDYHNQIIKVATTHTGDTRHNLMILETLLHEVIHAISAIWLEDKLSEKVVTKLSTALFFLLTQNNLMLREIKLPKKIKYGGFIYDIVSPPPKEIEMDEDSFFSTTNDAICRIYVKYSDSDAPFYIKSLFMKTLLKMVMRLHGSFSDEEVENIYSSCFYQGLYQVLVDNNIDTLIYNEYNKKVR
uniref:Uncharacterized protein n=1 Tax=viral metagenome TaxID=1070528 RepID=A0A6M3K3W8_9ZZZZ